MWIIAKITPAVNWPGLAFYAQQLLKTRGALAPVPPLFPCPCCTLINIRILEHILVSEKIYKLFIPCTDKNQ